MFALNVKSVAILNNPQQTKEQTVINNYKNMKLKKEEILLISQLLKRAKRAKELSYKNFKFIEELENKITSKIIN